MKFSVPQKSLVLIADGSKATLFRNVSASGITLEKAHELPLNLDDDRGASRLPEGTTPNQKEEAGFVKHIANDLFDIVQKNGFESLVLVADPHTLGQLRTNLHQEVTKRITGELTKTLTKSSISDIERTLASAVS